MIAKKNLYFFQTIDEEERYTCIRIGRPIKIGENITPEAYKKLFGELPDEYKESKPKKKSGRKKKTLCMQP